MLRHRGTEQQPGVTPRGIHHVNKVPAILPQEICWLGGKIVSNHLQPVDFMDRKGIVLYHTWRKGRSAFGVIQDLIIKTIRC